MYYVLGQVVHTIWQRIVGGITIIAARFPGVNTQERDTMYLNLPYRNLNVENAVFNFILN